MSRNRVESIAPGLPEASARLSQPALQVAPPSSAPARTEPGDQDDAVSFGDLPVLEARQREAAAALRAAASASSAAGPARPGPAAVATSTAKPTAAAAATKPTAGAPTAKPTGAARPRPASDPFSVRR